MCLVVILVLCCIFDLFYYRIPNVLIVAGIVVGLITSDIKNIMNGIIIFIILYPFFLIKGLGAGDIKLMIMVGCFQDWKTYITCMAISMTIAAIISIIKIITNEDCKNRMIYLAKYCRKLAITGVIDNYEVDKKNKRVMVRLSMPVLCGVLIKMLI